MRPTSCNPKDGTVSLQFDEISNLAKPWKQQLPALAFCRNIGPMSPCRPPPVSVCPTHARC